MKWLALACLMVVGCIGPEPTVDDPEDGGPIDGGASVSQGLESEAADAGGGEDAARALEASTVETSAPAPTPCDGPIFSPPGGAFKSDTSVSISTATLGATIFYTTDGTEPTAASRVYVTPMALVDTIVLRAFCTAPGFTRSIISEATFQIGDEPEDAGAGGGDS